MPDYGLLPGARQAIIRHILPKMDNLGEELFDELVANTPVDTGELRLNSYSKIDGRDGTIELGWDESRSLKPHGYYVHFGTSQMEARPIISEIVYKPRRPR